MYGLDVGSVAAKLVKLDQGEIQSHIIRPSNQWKKLLDDLDDNEEIYATGYFRKLVPNAKTVTEITAAIHGVKYNFPDAEVIVDIGGQDTKVIDIRTNEFLLNDKCSAGTGAFLELAANYFEISLEDLGKMHMKAQRRAEINDTCGVFAVSEMISQLAKGYTMEEVISGMHYAFSHRISHMLPESQKIVLIGGTAKNQGIVSALSDVCNKDFLIPPEPQIINAVGAVMYFESEQGE